MQYCWRGCLQSFGVVDHLVLSPWQVVSLSPRLCYEKVVSTDTTAAGGNTSLMVMSSDQLSEV